MIRSAAVRLGVHSRVSLRSRVTGLPRRRVGRCRPQAPASRAGVARCPVDVVRRAARRRIGRFRRRAACRHAGLARLPSDLPVRRVDRERRVRAGRRRAGRASLVGPYRRPAQAPPRNFRAQGVTSRPCGRLTPTRPGPSAAPMM
ncbi:hypothetical protein [Nocardia rhizosphaerihabitans]|uniref:hypothetical protein n=1 Tax=Nocardia rhizosphaerihabitans TaxID=1691570 RepID=UPI00166822E0|nr:hypothetical protein [Nocardia rhizosphaerihabitans]